MKNILRASQMRLADQATIEQFGIPGFTLMETAGRAIADQIVKWFGDIRGARVCCLCGKGNNAGDAMVVARCLHEIGADVTVLLLLGDNLSKDAQANLILLKRLRETSDRLVIQEGAVDDFSVFDLSVDGVLGTGLTKNLREPLAETVTAVNKSSSKVVALDIPSGIHADTGSVMGSAIRADLTITMGAAKPGLLLGEGPDHAGQIEVVDIGIPSFIFKSAAFSAPGPTFIPERMDIMERLPSRDRRAHKYSAGLALIVGGSPDLAGAPVMASLAAARAGAGAVVCAVPESIHSSVGARLTEVMTLSLPATDRGISPDSAPVLLKPRLDRAGSLLIGPGLGRESDTARFVWKLLPDVRVPVVVDADGLIHLAENPGKIASHSRGQWVLTPHLGELRHLAGDDIDVSDPIETARHLARTWDCILVFKGAPTVVATPTGEAYVNPTGNQGLATAGSGDVLAGMIAGFLAQGTNPCDAALCALYVGGKVVEHLSLHQNRDSLMAMDFVEALPETLRRLTD